MLTEEFKSLCVHTLACVGIHSLQNTEFRKPFLQFWPSLRKTNDPKKEEEEEEKKKFETNVWSCGYGAKMDHIRILSIGLELACNRG